MSPRGREDGTLASSFPSIFLPLSQPRDMRWESNHLNPKRPPQPLTRGGQHLVSGHSELGNLPVAAPGITRYGKNSSNSSRVRQ